MLSRPSTMFQKLMMASNRSILAPSFHSFGTSGQFPERYFLVEYSYIENAYYKRIPVRDAHLAALEKLKTSAQAKLITAPLFPYSGSVFFIMSQAEDPHAEVTKFVKDDPYVKAELVDSYRIREFAMTD